MGHLAESVLTGKGALFCCGIEYRLLGCFMRSTGRFDSGSRYQPPERVSIGTFLCKTLLLHQTVNGAVGEGTSIASPFTFRRSK